MNKLYLGLTNNKNLFLLFLTLACVSGIGSFFVPALLCLIIYYVKNRSELKQDIWSLEKFKTTIFFMILFLGCLLVSWAITGGAEGLKLVRNNFERMLPFIFVVIGLAGKGEIKEKLKYILYGSCLGIWIVCFSVLYKIFGLGIERSTSLLGSVNILGGTLILILPFIFVFIIKFRNEKKIFPFVIITSILLLFTLLVIKSRGSWLGLYVILLVLPLLLYKINQISLKKALLIDLLLIVGAAATYFIFYDALHRGYDFVRPGLRVVAWNIFLDYPLAGIGSSNFISNYTNGNFVNPLAQVNGVWTHAHNIYFKFLSENGILGFSGFIVLVFYQLKILWNSIIKRRNFLSLSIFLAVIGMLAHGWFDVCFSARYYAMTYWLLFGIASYFIFVETKDVNKLCKF